MSVLQILGAVLLTIGTFFTGEKATPPPIPPSYFLLVEEGQKATEEKTVELLTEESTKTVPEQEYLTCVVLSELLPTFSEETFRAQAVAARTFTEKMCRNGKHGGKLCDDAACCQAYTTPGALREKFGDQFHTLWEKASAAVADTAGEILTYNGEPAEAVYFACSGGRTESAVAVWGNEVPYLQSVDSPGEENASCFEKTICVPLKTFSRMLCEADAAVRQPILPQNWVGRMSKTDGGGVETLILGGVTFTGTQLRRLFSLPSTKFDLTVNADGAFFRVYGNGHRVGMSQYGAQAMAESGKTYREILKHYYPGTEIILCGQNSGSP